MKKITLFFVMLLIGFSGYSQYENFDDPSVANPTGLGPWILPSGTWQILQSGSGTVQWTLNTANQGTYPAYSDPHAAFINRENIGVEGNSSQDYLVTPAWAVPENAELHFWTRTTVAVNYATVFKIKACLGTDDPTNIASYTTTLMTWQEPELTTIFDEYQEKVVDVSQFPTGTVIHLAFVKEFTQPTGGGLNGERWLIDEVRLASKCLDPLDLTAASLSTSAVLSWDSPGPATSWNVWVLPEGTPFVPANLSPPFIAGDLGTGSNEGFTVTQTSELTPNPMVPVTEYVYYVQANCGSYTSTIVTSDVFTTQALPPECGGNYVDSGGVDGTYSSNENSTITICPADGEIVIVTFTSFATETNYDGILVYDGNSVLSPQIASDNSEGNGPFVDIAGAYWGNVEGQVPGPFEASNPLGCLTFTFMSDGSGEYSGFIANIECVPAPTCPKPSGLTAISATDASVTLTWTSITEPANGFELLATPCGSGVPAADAVGLPFVPESGDTSPYTFTYPGLSQNTCFDFWVRAKCSSTDISRWSLKESFKTQITPPACGGQYIDQGGSVSEEQDGNYFPNEDSIVTICPEEGQIVVVSFTSFATQEIYDGMLVYDGDSIFSPQIESENEAPDYGTFEDIPGAYWGDEQGIVPGPFESTNSLGCLTFRFLSDDWDERAGWVANVVCMPAPTCQKPTALAVVSTTQTEATVSWTAVGSATTYNVYAVPCGSPAPTGATEPYAQVVSTDTNVTTTLTGLDSAVCYQIYVISVCEGSDYSNPAGPKRAITKIPDPVCGSVFYDQEGPLDYENGSNYTVTICPDPANPNDIVTVNFTEFNIEPSDDGMYIFDGPDTDSPMIASENPAGWNWPDLEEPGAYWGDQSPGVVEASSESGCLTFVFTSGEWGGTESGWVAGITCGPAPTCPRPTALAVGVPTDTSIPVTWTPVGSATQWHVYAIPCGDPAPQFGDSGFQVANAPEGSAAQPFNFTGLTAYTCYQIYVFSVCSETDHSPNPAGPRTKKTQVTPPFCGGLFVDAGGVNDPYQPNSNSIVTVCPEAGDFVVVTFTSFETEPNYDALYVFDGNSTSAPQFSSANDEGNVPGDLPGGFWGNDIEEVFQSSVPGGCLTFWFRSDGGGDYNGWTATVECTPCPTPLHLSANPNIFYAELSWNFVEGTSYEVYVVPTGSPAPTEDSVATYSPVTTNPFITDSNLDPSTTYDFYVRVICPQSPNDMPWSKPNTFTTLPTCPQPINLNSTSTTSDATITWEEVGSATSWEIFIVSVGSEVPTFGTGIIVTQNPVVNPLTYTSSTLTNGQELVPGLYDYYVRSICTATDNSLIAGPNSFYIRNPDPICADLTPENPDLVDGIITLCPADGNCVDIVGNYTPNNQTNTYEIESIPFAPPFPFQGGIELTIDLDDLWGPAFTLPFNFCFFGENYSNVQVGSNGVVSFSPQEFGCPWSTVEGVDVPNANFPILNAIYGVYQDINPAVESDQIISINYQLIGEAPCRTFVINYLNIPQFSCGTGVDGDLLQTSQIVLYETSNVIDVYVKDRKPCIDWNGGRGVVGIQNLDGTMGYTPPGRNLGSWEAHNEAWRFRPSGESNVVFSWAKDGVFFSNDPAINVCVTENTTMTATAVYTGCGGTITTKTADVLIQIVTPEADVLTDVQVCSNVGYTLPALSENNHYFTAENCSGTELMPGDVITTPQTIYICEVFGECSASSNFVVDVFENPVVTIAGDCQGASYVLDATVTNPLTDGAYTYMWATEGGEIISGGDTASATVSGAGTYTVTVVLSVVNCEGEAQELVTSTSCTIQKGISVNGDGKNDVFDLSDFEVAKLEIYNRYGLKVYERKEYSNQWGGQSDKGDELPDGTYYYVIERKGGQPTVTGWIYINREN